MDITRQTRQPLVRALLAISLVVTVLVAGAPGATAQDAEQRGGKSGLALQTGRTAVITSGDTAWIALTWLATVDVDDVRVTVDKAPGGVQVTYPENTADHSGPMHGSTMVAGALDYTAIRLAVPYGSTDFEVRVVAEWTESGKKHKTKVDVVVPVTAHTGGDLAQITTAATVAAGTATWVEVEFAGLAPRIDGFVLSAANPDITIVHPGEDGATSLHDDDVLEDGETDVARLLVTADDAGPHVVALDITYAVNGSPVVLDGTLELVAT